MVPTEPPANEQQGPPFYHPPPPPMGYPPPPMSYPLPPQNGNPYAVPPQNYEGNFNPYSQQQYQMPYPPQQQPYNPYQVKEGKRKGFTRFFLLSEKNLYPNIFYRFSILIYIHKCECLIIEYASMHAIKFDICI